MFPAEGQCDIQQVMRAEQLFLEKCESEKIEKWKRLRICHFGSILRFEYRNTKGGFVAGLGLRSIFHLLLPLAAVFCKPRLGCKNVPNRRLELVCDDGSYHNLVLDKFKTD